MLAIAPLRRVSLALFAWNLGMLAFVPTVAAFTQSESEEGAGLEWFQPCVTYSIDFRGSVDLSMETVQLIVEDSFRAWTEVTCDGVSVGITAEESSDNATCQKAEFNSSDGNVNTIAFIDNWSELGYDPAAFALTTVFHNRRSGEILDVDLQVNENLGPYAICPAPGGCSQESDSVDLQNVMTHEVGHFFGLGHSNVISASMYFASRRGEIGKRFLRADDIAGLCFIYRDGFSNECNFSPRGGLDLDCEEETEGGSGGGGGCSCSVADDSPWSYAFLPIAVLTLLLRRRRSIRGIR
ncbi:MAG: matrixin family metalloprotease [Myxococcota bacterium]